MIVENLEFREGYPFKKNDLVKLKSFLKKIITLSTLEELMNLESDNE